MFDKIKEFVLGKKEQPKLEFPDSWLLVTFTPDSMEDGTEDDSNKIIIFYTFNRFGRRYQKKYPFSDERLSMLKKIHKVPVYDRTEKKVKFPVFSKINPGEIVYVE